MRPMEDLLQSEANCGSGVIVNQELGYMSDFSDSSFSFVNICRHYSQYQTTFPWHFFFRSIFLYSVCLHLCMLVFNTFELQIFKIKCLAFVTEDVLCTCMKLILN